VDRWTTLDPGRGDLESLLAVRSMLSTVSARTAGASDTVARARVDLANALGGETAEQADIFLGYLRKTDDSLSEVCSGLATAISAYVDTVNSIKPKVAPLLSERLEAIGELNVAYMDDPLNPPPDSELARRTQRWDAARTSFDAATADLNALATLRDAADDAFVAKVGQVLSAAWSDARITGDSVTDDVRDGANNEVWQLFAEFRDGAGNHRLLLDGDPFVELLKTSGHMNDARSRLAELLAGGSLHEGSMGTDGRDLSGQWMTLVGDGANVVTGGSIGNLPETYLGSYSLDYRVDSIDEHGNAVVTFTAHNTTTIESFARNPLGGQIPGFYDDLKNSQDKGMYQPTEQTIVWTETIRPS
jgi:hypothetical protein